MKWQTYYPKYRPTYKPRFIRIRRRLITYALFVTLVASGAAATGSFANYSVNFPNASGVSATIEDVRVDATVKKIKKARFALPILPGRIGRTNCGGGAVSGLPEFTYTGTYTLIDDANENWRIKFLTSGTFTPAESITIDVFCVGGGGGSASGWSGGAGGGRTTTSKSIVLLEGTGYTITIGAGGYGNSSGGNTSAFTVVAVGGNPGTAKDGGAGGSGGGRDGGGHGGSDGGGGYGGSSGYNGAGQGTTTREFGESTGTLYSGGGAGSGGIGGDGGGGNSGQSGAANTGGGGGGLYGGISSGGSGIAVIRNHRAA